MAIIDRILIVGGGIGGLSCATALHQHGFTPTLVERSPEWRATGGGIGVLANGMRMLRVLGLDGAVAQAGAVGRRWAFSNARGEILCDTDLDAVWGDVGHDLVGYCLQSRDRGRSATAEAINVAKDRSACCQSLEYQRRYARA